MRFAWLLPPEPGAAVDAATAAEDLGYDAVWIDGADAASTTIEPAPLAARLAATTSGVRVGVTAVVGRNHPIELAEQMAVADLALGGRLVLSVRSEPGTGNRLAEALDLMLDCFASHPFRHAGPTWPAPANRPENTFNLEQRIRVTPAPAQFELPVWVAGVEGRAAATERALGILADTTEDVEDVATWWEATRSEHPSLARRIRRATRWTPPTDGIGLHTEVAVKELRVWQRRVDLDLVVVDAVAVPDLAMVSQLMADIAHHVRPRVQLDRYPPGLEAHWTSGSADPGIPNTESRNTESEGANHG